MWRERRQSSARAISATYNWTRNSLNIPSCCMWQRRSPPSRRSTTINMSSSSWGEMNLLQHKLQRNVQRKNTANNVVKVKTQGTMTKWPYRKKTFEQHETRRAIRTNRHLEFYFSIFPIMHNVNWAIQKTESFVYLQKHATFEVTCSPSLVGLSDTKSSILSIR